MNDKFEQYCTLRAQGKTRDEIIRELEISGRTFYRYERKYWEMVARLENGAPRGPLSLTPANYYAVIKWSFSTKEEMAKYFDTTKPTLNKYEAKWDAQRRIGRALYVLGNKKPIDIVRTLHLSTNTGLEDAAGYINGLPNLKGIAKNLEVVINVLREFAEFDPEVAPKIRILEIAREGILEVLQ